MFLFFRNLGQPFFYRILIRKTGLGNSILEFKKSFPKNGFPKNWVSKKRFSKKLSLAFKIIVGTSCFGLPSLCWVVTTPKQFGCQRGANGPWVPTGANRLTIGKLFRLSITPSVMATRDGDGKPNQWSTDWHLLAPAGHWHPFGTQIVSVWWQPSTMMANRKKSFPQLSSLSAKNFLFGNRFLEPRFLGIPFSFPNLFIRNRFSKIFFPEPMYTQIGFWEARFG